MRSSIIAAVAALTVAALGSASFAQAPVVHHHDRPHPSAPPKPACRDRHGRFVKCSSPKALHNHPIDILSHGHPAP